MLTKLIAEATEIDFKVALEVKKPKSWLKSVSAFANGIGGVLLFGVDDDRNIVGLANAQQAAEAGPGRIEREDRCQQQSDGRHIGENGDEQHDPSAGRADPLLSAHCCSFHLDRASHFGSRLPVAGFIVISH